MLQETPAAGVAGPRGAVAVDRSHRASLPAGTLYYRGEPNYEALLGLVRTASGDEPHAIGRATGREQAVTLVRQAREAGLPIVTVGSRVRRDGRALILAEMTAPVRVDPVARTATVPAGRTWRDVLKASLPFGLLAPAGVRLDDDALAFTLSGGVGAFARRYGIAANLLTSVSLITSTGERIKVDKHHEADLFWLIRGGGVIPGIVVEATFHLPAFDGLLTAELDFESDQLGALTSAWASWTSHADWSIASGIEVCAGSNPSGGGPWKDGRLRFSASLVVDRRTTLALGHELMSHLLDDIAPVPQLHRTVNHAVAAEALIAWPETRLEAEAFALSSTVGLIDDQSTLNLAAALSGTGDECRGTVELRHLGGAVASPWRPGGAVDSYSATYAVRATGDVPFPVDHAEPQVIDALTMRRLHAVRKHNPDRTFALVNPFAPAPRRGAITF